MYVYCVYPEISKRTKQRQIVWKELKQSSF